jgi:DNA polymerase eta
VQEFFSTFPLKKVRNLGGKLGLALREEFNCTTMADIVQIPERVLQDRFDSKTG